MAVTANNVANSLPREMQQHTYSIMYEVEEHHWWFVGRRKIIERFVAAACREIGKRKPRILDVGCGTGANLQMLAKHGASEGVDVSGEADVTGFVVLTRGTDVRRIPFWLRGEQPQLAAEPATALNRPGVHSGTTIG